jgi:hypothetical protein
MQVKLLRVLQHKEFERVGDPKTTKVDVRIIVSTNQNLEKAIEEAYRAGWLGNNILGSGFSLNLSVHIGAGAYIPAGLSTISTNGLNPSSRGGNPPYSTFSDRSGAGRQYNKDYM